MPILNKENFSFSFNPSKCELCGGKCCTGASGYIWTNKDTQKNIADFLGIDIDIFTKKYTKKHNNRTSLIEKKIGYNNYACVFFDIEKKICSIYSVRPEQCKTYPFWESLRSQDAKKVQQECLGITPK